MSSDRERARRAGSTPGSPDGSSPPHTPSAHACLHCKAPSVRPPCTPHLSYVNLGFGCCCAPLSLRFATSLASAFSLSFSTAPLPRIADLAPPQRVRRKTSGRSLPASHAVLLGSPGVGPSGKCRPGTAACCLCCPCSRYWRMLQPLIERAVWAEGWQAFARSGAEAHAVRGCTWLDPGLSSVSVPAYRAAKGRGRVSRAQPRRQHARWLGRGGCARRIRARRHACQWRHTHRAAAACNSGCRVTPGRSRGGLGGPGPVLSDRRGRRSADEQGRGLRATARAAAGSRCRCRCEPLSLRLGTAAAVAVAAVT